MSPHRKLFHVRSRMQSLLPPEFSSYSSAAKMVTQRPITIRRRQVSYSDNISNFHSLKKLNSIKKISKVQRKKVPKRTRWEKIFELNSSEESDETIQEILNALG